MNSIYFIKCQSGTENDRKLLIRSAVHRAESTGAECTAKDIAEMLTTQPSDEESMGGEEMSGTDDVPLRYLKGEEVKCCNSEIREVTMADFSEDEESSDETVPVLTDNMGASSGTAARGIVSKNKARNANKWIHSKKKKPRKKKRDGPIEMPSNSEKWENFFMKHTSRTARKKKHNIKTVKQVREEEERKKGLECKALNIMN